MKVVTAFMIAGSLPLAAHAADHPASPAWARARQLNERLLAGTTATATLRQWCADHGIADPTIHADVLKVAAPRATAAQRHALQVDDQEPLGYRRVRLMCGSHVLSEAENWYVPARLTDAMNTLLAASDTPFGTVVAPLRVTRRNLAAEMLWRHGDTPPPALFRHRALVLDASGRPIAEVVETYQRAAIELP